MSDKIISSTTQEFLDVYDIVNDMVLLKDGTASIILQVGTMNFSLLAEQEQDAIIFTYGSLLNSLNYPIQISIQSQTKDVTKYLRLLDEQIQKASSDRKANLIKQYRNFVAALIKERNVLEKHFYVTIPASAVEMGFITPSSVLPGKASFNIADFEKSIILEKAINILEPRRDHLISQFNRLGLYTRQLNTQEIIQNFYINYNPEAAEGQEISSNENYTTPLVRASFGRKIMQTNQQNPTPEEILSNSPTNVPVAANTTITEAAPVTNIETTPAANTMPIVESTPIANSTPAIVVTDAPVSTFNESTPVDSPTVNIESEIEQENAIPEINNPEPPAAEVSMNPQASVDLNLDSNLISGQAPDPSSSQETTIESMTAPEPTIVSEQTVTPESVVEPVTPSTTEQAPIQEPVVAQELPTPPELNTTSPTSEPSQVEVEEVQIMSGGQSDFAEEITPMQGNLEPQTPSTPIQNTEENKILEPQI